MKHKKLLFWILGLVGGLIILSTLCGVGLMIATKLSMRSIGGEGLFDYAEDDYYYNDTDYGDTEMMAMEAPSAGYATMEKATAPAARGSSSQGSSGQEKLDQKVIKTGSLNLVVKKVSAAITKITELVAAKDGFISDSDVYTRNDKTQYGTIIVRVPAQHFETTLNGIKTLAEVVEKENISGVDVTEEFIDLQSRLKNLRLEEEQYQAVLKKATKVEEILKVNEYLFATREEIEVIEGRIKYLTNLTDLATIRVNLTEEPTIEIPTAEWRPFTTIKNAFRAMIRFWQGAVNTIIWLAFLGIPLAVVVWALYKVIRMILKKQKAGKKGN